MVAYVPGGDLELAVTDPEAGVAFYGLTPPRRCLPLHADDALSRVSLHAAYARVPGLFVASVGVTERGAPLTEPTVTDHRTPFSERWGGWYVDGDAPPSLAPAPPSSDAFDGSRYLRPWSDPVALMTLEHQTQMVNLLTRLAWESRLHRHGGLIGLRAGRANEGPVDEVLAYMLFVDEAPLGEGRGRTVSLQSGVSRRGPHDRFGRSLRDFDLVTRLFRYPLSYMIYSRAFDAIEPVVREFLLRRLYDVLIGTIRDRSTTVCRLRTDRRSCPILRDTKPNLPTYWRPRRPER